MLAYSRDEKCLPIGPPYIIRLMSICRNMIPFHTLSLELNISFQLNSVHMLFCCDVLLLSIFGCHVLELLADNTFVAEGPTCRPIRSLPLQVLRAELDLSCLHAYFLTVVRQRCRGLTEQLRAGSSCRSLS